MIIKTVAGLTVLVAGLGAGTVAVEQASEELIPAAYELTAYHSIRSVAHAATALSMVTGDGMAEALRDTDLRQGGGNLTVDGTVITWSMDGECWMADVPTNTSILEVVPCT